MIEIWKEDLAILGIMMLAYVVACLGIAMFMRGRKTDEECISCGGAVSPISGKDLVRCDKCGKEWK